MPQRQRRTLVTAEGCGKVRKGAISVSHKMAAVPGDNRERTTSLQAVGRSKSADRLPLSIVDHGVIVAVAKITR